MSGIDAVAGPLQRHRNVPVRFSDGLTASALLALSESPFLAINGH
jgi:hypothetical protein